MIQIKLNGKPAEVPDSARLTDLLTQLGLSTEGVAVAVNDSVIPKAKHPQFCLKSGDVVEVISAVGGG